MAKTQYVCMSNTIILDRRLKPSAVRVMSALLRFRRSNGTASVRWSGWRPRPTALSIPSKALSGALRTTAT